MNKLNSNKEWDTKKFICSIIGHHLVIKRTIIQNFNEFECTFCHCELTNDDKGRTISLTPHLKDVNETLYNFHNRRNKIAV